VLGHHDTNDVVAQAGAMRERIIVGAIHDVHLVLTFPPYMLREVVGFSSSWSADLEDDQQAHL
jgi:hypothetical protein